MYSTCLFCKNNLGANEAIEKFPVGRRLAFDAAKGRLWVVCRKCERWNLTPVEQRWEAIEECERSFRGTRLRTSTDQIGLARLSEGLELVRIGKPLRPEFAGWRYGDQFGARRRRHFISVGAVSAAAVAVPFVGPMIGISLGALGLGHVEIAGFANAFYQHVKVHARLPGPEGRPLVIRCGDVEETVMLSPSGNDAWGLRVTHRKHLITEPWWRYSTETETTEIHGDDALHAAAQLLPRLNRKGARRDVIQEAVKLSTVHADPVVAFSEAARVASGMRSWIEYEKGPMLKLLPLEHRLALEMLSHEDAERRALEGELYVLEEAWREAEEIAAISDNLFLPAAILSQLEGLKRRRN